MRRYGPGSRFTYSTTEPVVERRRDRRRLKRRQRLIDKGRRLASERDDLIAGGVDPAELEVPRAPEGDQ